MLKAGLPPARQLHPGHGLLLLLALLCLWLALRALDVWMQPVDSSVAVVRPTVADPALLAGSDPFHSAPVGDAASLPVTSLPLSLHGIRTDIATGRGAAIIAAGDGEQQIHEIGDTIADGVTLAAIAADHVILSRNGVHEALWLDSAGDAPVETFSPAAASASGPATEEYGVEDVDPLVSATDNPDVDYDAIDAAVEAAVVPAAPPARR